MNFGAPKGHPPLSVDLGEHLDGLYSYALVLSRNDAEAEDLVQETCLRALRAMGKLRPDSNAKGWLFTILRNVWLNQLRRRRTAPEVAEYGTQSSVDRVPDTTEDPHAAYVSNIEREQIRFAIQQLPEEWREIILLREYEELSYQEIAAVLECPVGTVMSRLARARSRLRELLPPPAAELAPGVKESNEAQEGAFEASSGEN
ncbi:MAG TPA: sigma-70 family RNA polymerase sigma factor [Candidatus Baltobacteraceae bacterium]|nr:sigma-70 family RNA polymerase sigma factor [Candidatus Baltobacteraceae bacterium]